MERLLVPHSVHLFRSFVFAVFGASLAIGSTHAQTLDGLHDFQLGSSFVEAQRNATANGWELKQSSLSFPYEWVVEGTDLRLFICENRVAAIGKHPSGEFEEFVSIVWNLQLRYGAPTTKVATFMAGATRISLIDANFALASDEHILVQLGHWGDKLSIHMNYSSDIECQAAVKP
ncbi:hypothetical protein NOJ28_03485 [Neorhizobium galegae]|uniref:hypothetical protein n=1 Tax=Neorhizobium galegae TaxID=399 RepID=UPI00069BCC65|nr:hypothetical protein [Neorhizobium galegae]MCQ1764583.1 hypothetical protein [Neorhizobium galegae]MCQ1847697.1 hypothetical protein [Neorhizobium galegae]